jgi:LPS-assembly lipoprotein
MLLSKRSFVLAALTLPLAGCFTPLYGERTNGASTKAELAQIDVAEIAGRAGIQLRNDLVFNLSGTGERPQNPLYLLTVTLTAQGSLGVTDATAYRPVAESILVNAIFTLTDMTSKKQIIKGSAAASTSIDTSQQRYARDRGRIDATDRAYKGVGDQIIQQLAAYFATR